MLASNLNLILICSEVLANAILIAKICESLGLKIGKIVAQSLLNAHGIIVWPCAQASVTFCIQNHSYKEGILAFSFYIGRTEAMHFSVSSVCMAVYACVYVHSFLVFQTASQTQKPFSGGSFLFPVLPAGPSKRLSSLSPSPTPVSFFSSYIVWVTCSNKIHTPPKGLGCLIPFP